jgi:hypothetical protein
MERSCQLETLVMQAAGIVAGSQKTIGIRRAMELVGFTECKRKNMKLYQQVRRKSVKLSVVEIGKGSCLPAPIKEAVDEPSVSTVSTLTVSIDQNSTPKTGTIEINVQTHTCSI